MIYSTKQDAVEQVILPSLAEHAETVDQDRLFEETFTWRGTGFEQSVSEQEYWEAVQRNTIDPEQVASIIRRAAPDVNVQVQGDTLWLATRPYSQCEGCGQSIDTGDVGPALWLEGDVIQGRYSFQHGCGAWNTPVIVSYTPTAGSPEEQANQAVGRIRRAVEKHAVDGAHAVEERLRRMLRDPASELNGSDVNPGVYYEEDGTLVAWDYHPHAGNESSPYYGDIVLVKQ